MPSADQGKISPRAVLLRAAQLYGGHFSRLIIIAAAAIPLATLYWVSYETISDGWLVDTIALPLFAGIAHVVLTSALVPAVAAAWEDRQPDPTQAFAVLLSNLPALILAAFIVEAAFVALTISVIGTPLAIYLLVRWALFPQAILLERAGVREALARSSRLVAHSWWRVASVLLVAALPATISASFVTLIIFDTGAFEIGLGLTAPAGLVGALLGILTAVWAPFNAAAQTILFFHLRDRLQLAVPT